MVVAAGGIADAVGAAVAAVVAVVTGASFAADPDPDPEQALAPSAATAATAANTAPIPPRTDPFAMFALPARALIANALSVKPPPPLRSRNTLVERPSADRAEVKRTYSCRCTRLPGGILAGSPERPRRALVAAS
jgi:hypothetical protein